MQFSGTLGHLLQVVCEGAIEIAVESRFELSIETWIEISHQVPHPGIRIERQAANGNTGYEIASRGEKHFHQGLVFGEEQNVAHEAAHGFRGRQLIHAVHWALLQEE